MDQARVEDLLAELQQAEPEQAERLVAQLRAEWSKSGSATIDLLVDRGRAALEEGDVLTAAEHLTAAIDHDPDFAEAYQLRATAYYLGDRIGPALDDLRQALVLNPDNFDTMKGVATLLEELERPEDAQEVWMRITALNPHDPEAEAALARLERSLGGQPT
ncbi:tetratricopeptide repeat protein [Pseudoroseicyclus aestuarii]|uniref:tetratricopeptide repeat protein n=1 Tax=Pseudoroseicyclus aestuarii TaxID=1795041 RepID=UPI001FE5E244|nr:tetratricopeptide repeat protein [Pseudoroseicyclus aestuarii]